MTGPEPRAGHEAARLLAAAQDWLRTSAPHLAPLAPDGEPCSCPVCRAVAGLREADPDSVGRWVDSAVTTIGSLVVQAGDLAASRSPEATDADAGEPDDTAGDDGYATVDDSRAEDATEEVLPGQDGPRPRRVRRIPITREDETNTSTS